MYHTKLYHGKQKDAIFLYKLGCMQFRDYQFSKHLQSQCNDFLNVSCQ